MQYPVLKAITVSLLFGVAATSAVSAPATRQVTTVADIGLATPESVEYNRAADVYLVANINGDPFAADGNGFISKIGPDGKLLNLKWIESGRDGAVLNAPKGMAVVGKRLFVADIDHVRIFGLPDGKPLGSFKIEGSSFLNGITPADGDSVYVTDSGFEAGFKPSGNDAVYQMHANGKYRAVVKDPALGKPNGVVLDGDRLMVVTFGSGELLSVSKNGTWRKTAKPEQGGLDGLLKLKDGRLLVSSWGGSALYTVDRKGGTTLLNQGLDAPADLGFDSKRNRILVPLFKQNALVFVPL